MDNTHKIAERCNVEIVFGEQKVPKFDVPEGYDAFSYLKELCETGLVKRYGDPPPQELQERLSYELSTIKNMGYVDYFLIVWDFIRFAKSQGIAVGPFVFWPNFLFFEPFFLLGRFVSCHISTIWVGLFLTSWTLIGLCVVLNWDGQYHCAPYT